MTAPLTLPVDGLERRRVQRRTIAVLIAGQIISGLGIGAAVSMGALLVAAVTGSEAWSGMAATMNTLGAALFAIPLALLARRRGRRISLTTGAVTAALGAFAVVVSAVLDNPFLLLLSMAVLGIGSALNFHSRFAATDLATDSTRGRDLSLVVWSTTIGAVVGPNLAEPSDVLGRSLGLPELTGGFVIAAAAQLLGALLYAVALRPDPLLLALGPHRAVPAGPQRRAARGLAILRSNLTARRAVLATSLSHAVMVALMGMTPIHLMGHGADLTIVGITISLHIAGMFGISPVFGLLTDRVGGRAVILLGQVLLTAALLVAALGSQSNQLVAIALVLLGLGWSASNVAGSTMLSGAVPVEQRPATQGTSDLLMNLAGAGGGALAGLILAGVGFSGLALCLLMPVAVVTLDQLVRRR
ncbi:MFS transporter [Brachybacterium avium]|uniref:MFS transporter n=1 Tax=Brachybacterium avium TaxID=2017485 RepID=A0A220UEF7_9MICO|nr:MFS transporter [Brachybacterium avium]ASK66286.1 MFS transporter [Brachybacterium avium]